MKEEHLPVLVEEVITMLAPAPGSLQIDATVGGGVKPSCCIGVTPV